MTNSRAYSQLNHRSFSHRTYTLFMQGFLNVYKRFLQDKQLLSNLFKKYYRRSICLSENFLTVPVLRYFGLQRSFVPVNTAVNEPFGGTSY